MIPLIVSTPHRSLARCGIRQSSETIAETATRRSSQWNARTAACEPLTMTGLVRPMPCLRRCGSTTNTNRRNHRSAADRSSVTTPWGEAVERNALSRAIVKTAQA